MNVEDLSFPPYSPEFEVWNHLEGALDQAAGELDELGEKERAFVDGIAKLFADLRKRFALSASDRSLLEALEVLVPDPWVRHAADLELVRDGVYRATRALDRYVELKPAYVSFELARKPRNYVAEAVQTFIYGFDASCIAFCGAALEHTLLEALIQVGHYKRPSSNKEKTPPASKLVDAAEGLLISESVGAARRVFAHRNTIMHREYSGEGELRRIARECVADLAAVLEELPGEENSAEGLA